MQNLHHLRVMSKRRKRIILPACGILAVGLVWALLAPREREPSYRGRTVSQLLKDIDQGRWGAWDDAPIRAIGTHAIPACLTWISFEDSPLRDRIAKLVEFVSPTLARRLTLNPWWRSFNDALGLPEEILGSDAEMVHGPGKGKRKQAKPAVEILAYYESRSRRK